MAFALYLDDSDSDGGPITVLAGYYARLDDWENFEREAGVFCNEHRVPVLHAMKFHRTHEPFKGWSGKKKKEFASGLYKIASRHSIGGQCASLRKKDFLNKFKGDKIFSQYSALGVCFNTLLFSWLMQSPIREQILSEGISIFLESGHKNNSNIEKIFHEFQEFEFFQDSLRSLTIVPKSSSRAIQLADFLAFHGRRNASIWDSENYHGEPFRDDILRIISDAIPTTFHRGRGIPVEVPLEALRPSGRSHSQHTTSPGEVIKLP